MQEKTTYKSSGVDIEAGNAFVERLKQKVPTIGGFGGMFKVPRGYEEPILVSGTDGVGTKINICKIANDYTTIGQDLVAMCVNDIITCGAKPLYFLDYISTGKISPILDEIMEGIIKGCEIAEMDLLGGETAEHPRQIGYDLAGFCTGIVEEFDIVDGRLIKPGDCVIGLASSGLHSNGFSLINRLMFHWDRDVYKEFFDLHSKEEVLTPTRIYASIVKDLMDNFPILGMAHITGGGLPENLPRCLPEGIEVDIDYNSWPRPQIFESIAKYGTVVEEEMRSIFNLGIGYCIVVPPDLVEDVLTYINLDLNVDAWAIGTCTRS